jgi:hypothetical protein
VCIDKNDCRREAGGAGGRSQHSASAVQHSAAQCSTARRSGEGRGGGGDARAAAEGCYVLGRAQHWPLPAQVLLKLSGHRVRLAVGVQLVHVLLELGAERVPAGDDGADVTCATQM